MNQLIGHWIANFEAVIVAAWLLQNSGYFGTTDGLNWTALAIFAAVLAGLNLFVRPVLLLITTPLRCLTFGLFTLVLNALIFWFAASLVSGIFVSGFGGAFLAALVVTLVSFFVGLVVIPKAED
ncbi:MAG: phage holin family protein [Chloroflexi bacterium]|nr:phage holin family protein [Chloroflexota bacterium]